MSHALMYLLQSVLVKSRERGKKEAKEKMQNVQKKCAKRGANNVITWI